mgnify:CR=1 FL=1
MLLHFNTSRLLAVIAAEARNPTIRAAQDVPWRRPLVIEPSAPPPCRRAGTESQLLDHTPFPECVPAIRAAIVGDTAMLEEHLITDAVGWSPSLAYTSRKEAQIALRDRTALLTVAKFELESILWSDPHAFVEWRVEARQSEPMLVGEETLIRASDDAFELVGASVVAFQRRRVAIARTYFDDAFLIEQVILGSSRWS